MFALINTSSLKQCSSFVETFPGDSNNFDSTIFNSKLLDKFLMTVTLADLFLLSRFCLSLAELPLEDLKPNKGNVSHLKQANYQIAIEQK